MFTRQSPLCRGDARFVRMRGMWCMWVLDSGLVRGLGRLVPICKALRREWKMINIAIPPPSLQIITRLYFYIWQMVITRLIKAEGFRWRKWNLINENTGNKSRIPEEHQNQIVIEYHINPLIYEAHTQAFEAHKKERETRKRYQPTTQSRN